MIIVAGDTHLKKYVYNSHRELENDTVEGFKAVVDFATKKDAEAIILAGDVWDPLTSWSLMQYDNILSNYDGKVFGIDGNPNHDRANPPWMTINDVRGRYFHKDKVEIGGFSFYGLRNMPRSKAKDAFPEVPECDFLICHQLVTDISWAPGAWDLDPDWIPSHVDKVISGDCHDPSVVFDIPSGNKGVYTGTTVPQSRGEIGYDTGFSVITDAGEVKRVGVEVRPIHRVKVEGREDVDEVMSSSKVQEMLDKDGPAPALFLDYPIGDPVVLEHINEVTEEAALHVFPYAYSDSAEEEDISEITTDSSNMMVSAAEQFTDSEEVLDLASRLINDFGKSTLEEYREEFDPDNVMGVN